MDSYPNASSMQPSTSYGSQQYLSSSNPSSTHSSPRSFTHDLDPSTSYSTQPAHSQTYPIPGNPSWSPSLQQPQAQQRRPNSFQNRASFSGTYFHTPNTPSLQVSTNTTSEHDPNECTARPSNAHVHAQFHNSLSLPLPPMPDSGNSLVTPTATTAGSSSISSMESAGLSSAPSLSSASSVGSNFVEAQQQHLQDQRQAALDSGSDYIAGTPGLSKGLSRPLTQLEKDRLEYLDRLKYFLATAPSRWHSTDAEQGGPLAGGSTPFAPNVNVYPGMGVDGSFSAQATPNTPSHPQLNRFMLPSQEFVTCVLWNGLYHITGTDIVRALVFRFEAFGRPVRNMKKFEEGVFSDLRNLKPGVDACLEEPKSPFLDLLFKYQCIRTQKKQKVFYWFSVPHDRLFLDALDRDLKREKMGQEPTTVVTGEPAASFTYDPKRPLYEQFSKMLGAVDGESEFDRNVRLAVKDSRRTGDSATDGDESSMDDESDMPSDADDERRPRTASDALGKQIFGQIQLLGSRTYKHRKRTAKRGSRQEGEGLGDEPRGRGDIPGTSGGRYGSTSASRERSRAGISMPHFGSMRDEFGPGSVDEMQQSEPSLSAADFFLKQAKGELLPADGIARKPRVHQPVGEVEIIYSEGAPPPPSSASSASSEFSLHSVDGSGPRSTFNHSRTRSVDVPSASSHPHRHSYHGSLSSSFADSFSYLGSSGATQDPAAQSTGNAPNSQPRSDPSQPAPVSSTAMYEQHGPDGKIKAFVCPLFSCGRLFKRMEHLKRHLRTHTMERPFACTKCNKKFSRSDNLNQHLRTHDRTGSGPAANLDGGDESTAHRGGGDSYMEDDSEQEAERMNRVTEYASGEESEEDALARFNSLDGSLYGGSMDLNNMDPSAFAMVGGYSASGFPMRELEARDVQEVQGDEEGLLVLSPSAYNDQSQNNFYPASSTLFGTNGGFGDPQWSTRAQPSTGYSSFGNPTPNPLQMRGNRNSMGSLPSGYPPSGQGHSAHSSISSIHGDELAPSLSAPVHKPTFDLPAMYQAGMILDDTSSSGGPIRRHRSMTPSLRNGEPIRRPPTASSGEFNPAIPGSTPSSVGSSSSASSHRGYHPYAGYSSSRGGSAHSSPAAHNIPLGGAGDYTGMRSRASSFVGAPPLPMMGSDVSMAPPDNSFGEAMYRTESPAFMAQTESPAPYNIDLPGQYGGGGAYYATQQPAGHSATMPTQYPNQQQASFADGYYPPHVNTL
ncbi:STE-12 alpha [Coprinopsis cinerea AmutBmut pab1-1]|nr:STE-12 alpha [Coprinopsis cinerea AmutBmut pab1-1]